MGPSHIPQTFGLRGHRDLIAKLRWEIEGTSKITGGMPPSWPIAVSMPP
jgi:hypothetical protein